MPPEILELIVNCLADVLHDSAAEKWPRCQLELEREEVSNTLVACHGLSHFLRIVAARHLFRHVHLQFDDERDKTRTSQLYDIIWSDPTDRSNVLHHIRNLSITLPKVPTNRVRTWLSRFLDHASTAPTTLLESLRVTFYPDTNLLRLWTSLDAPFRAVLVSVCHSKNLTRRLVFIRAADLPRTLFRCAGPRVLELDGSTGVDSDLPDVYEPALAHARQSANAEEVKLDGEYPFEGLQGVRVVTIVQPEEYTYSCLSQWNATLEEINSSAHYLAMGEMESTVATTTFHRLERINIDDLYFTACSCPSHDSLPTTSFNPGFMPLFISLNHLMINKDNVPALRRINIKVSLALDPAAFNEKRACVWYAPSCRHQQAAMPWSFLDQFFVDCLGHHSILFAIDFVVYMPDVPAPPDLVRYWKAYASEWVLGSVPSILPISLERFPNNFTFDPLA